MDVKKDSSLYAYYFSMKNSTCVYHLEYELTLQGS